MGWIGLNTLISSKGQARRQEHAYSRQFVDVRPRLRSYCNSARGMEVMGVRLIRMYVF